MAEGPDTEVGTAVRVIAQNGVVIVVEIVT